MKFILGVALGLGATTIGATARPAENYIVWGHGNASCASWRTDRRNEDSRAPYVAWVQGFLTASGRVNKVPRLKEADIAALEELIDKKCAGSSIRTLESAAAGVFLELVGR